MVELPAGASPLPGAIDPIARPEDNGVAFPARTGGGDEDPPDALSERVELLEGASSVTKAMRADDTDEESHAPDAPAPGALIRRGSILGDVMPTGWQCDAHRVGHHDVFCSYRVACEGKTVLRLARAIEDATPPGNAKLTVFVDKSCLNAGEPWDFALKNGLEGAALVVPLISQTVLDAMKANAATQRDNVLMEWEAALDGNSSNKNLLLPVFIGHIDFHEDAMPDLPHALGGRSIRRTVAAMLKVNGIQIPVVSPLDPGGVNDDGALFAKVTAEVHKILASQERYARRMRSKLLWEEEQMRDSVMWGRVSRVLDRGEIIGRGGSSLVYKGLLNGQPVAVKALKMSHDEARASAELFRTELRVMLDLEHPNIVPLRDAIIRSGGAERYLIMDLMAEGSLESQLFSAAAGGISDWRLRLRIAAGVSSGLQYLHTRKPAKILHRDIKPANILLDAQFVAHVADFGVSRLAPELELGATQVSTKSYVATRGYDAPECSFGTFSPKSDVFALGVVFLQLATGQQATISGGRDVQLLRAFVVDYLTSVKPISGLGDPRVAWPPAALEGLLSLGLRCTEEKRDARPVLSEVLFLLEALSSVEEAAAEGPATVTPAPRPAAIECQLCTEAPRTVAFEPCGHVLACASCAEDLIRVDGGATCFYCRAAIKAIRPAAVLEMLVTYTGSPIEHAPSGLAHHRKVMASGAGTLLAGASITSGGQATGKSFAGRRAGDGKSTPISYVPSTAYPEPDDFDAVVGAGQNLQSAVDGCRNGGVLLLSPGTHLLTDTLRLSRDVSLFGQGRATLRGHGKPLLLVTAVQVVVDGLVLVYQSGKTAAVEIHGGSPWLQNCDIQSKGRKGAALTLLKSGAVLLNNKITCEGGGVIISGAGAAPGRLEACEVWGCGETGVEIRDGADCMVVGNKIRDGRGDGCVLRKTACLFEGNDVWRQAKIGVLVMNSSPRIIGNCIHEARHVGLYFRDRSNGVAQGNEIFANSAAGLEITTESSPTIVDNKIRDGFFAGVLVRNKGRGVITGNLIIENNGGGIIISCRGFPIVSGNKISKCRRGMIVMNALADVGDVSEVVGNYEAQVSNYFWMAAICCC